MRRLGAVVFCSCLGAISACAPALREPPPLETLAAASPRGWDPARLAREAEARFAERTLASVREAARLWTRAAEQDPTSVEPLVAAARARVWLAEHEGDAEARRQAAVEAVQTAQWCVERAPGEPACTYWLAAALGVQARERRATALDALPRIEALFLEVAEAAPELEHAGADRALALLYARAPGWPRGPGDPDLALEHARRAVARAPDYPPNQLALGEALEGVGELEAAREAYRRALERSRQAHARGDPDAAEWLDAARRALARLKGEARSRPVASPPRAG